ncbi:MAG: phenylpropionate dioxygenase-like ring-hydroxylating dioxygenase large terminal subunit [Candidatus Azotimanducaceae bacterium]|jgi:phenylpropionate dioxygenase-like ring-hydroxylating dioxygenase large terminal subunit
MSESNKITAHSSGISYQDLIASDRVPAPEVLKLTNPIDLPDVKVSISQFTSKEFHDLEMEKLWPRVWQMACREEEIPNVGDHIVYEIGKYSIIVVRTDEGIKAHHNACLHRGRRLRDRDGSVGQFTCPFHGFTWKLDGSLKHIPSRWDFPDIEDEKFCLPGAHVGTWGGWVFINMSSDQPEPLMDFLGVLPEHFEVWQPENCYTSAHVGKIMKANWKVVQEAFMEAYHVIMTHPQLLAGVGDENSQYDVWGNISRAITPNGTPSPHINFVPSEQDMFDAITDRRADGPPVAELPQGMTARAMSAAGARSMLNGVVDREVSDAELADSIYYSVFPNFHPWCVFNRIQYRFRPYGDDHDKSIMEVYFLSPFKGERPAPAKLNMLNEDQDWTDAEELGMLARVFNQDSMNIPNVQIGLHATQAESPVFARYQESKIRHFHYLLDQWIYHKD